TVVVMVADAAIVVIAVAATRNAVVAAYVKSF
ncbi:hypothetical protein A2U01_0034017, partial [Trifolium medium]|nr:hypothetical protein [Trifolium medium]